MSKIYNHYLKRLFDLAVGLVLLIFLALPIVLLALLIRVKMGSPVLFTQERGGYGCKPFSIYKFRSMTDARDGTGKLLHDSQRITALGRFLRSSSLDELPSLINLIRGDIGLVGPRPFIYDYMELYPERYRKRHDVRPGITGWAQVKGRNAISWEEKFEYDLWYVEHRGFLLDLKIIGMTIKKLFKRGDVNSGQDETMPRYTGSPE